ncbi:hypothetical protein Q73A0000_00795 [Kaistella flava (ex Peng et al. 2021)]|uniref:Lipoprotein n=1 Tax=Kaistella flava (ex Peng et al. 2021) TaxID=2038776 RepID=A0A7M2Y435_9FLAO|nr:hypothetical protein [Kaistella flava (ex Peng et al. 2021)]QOW08987.1 hypothetical protein Q73A0000_00795 [Kaistella flava (ex Peng et al. 2021)]
MKKLFLSAILGLAIVVSCEKKQEEHVEHEHTTTEQTATDEHVSNDEHATAEEHDESVKLDLNNGAKWPVNSEMKPHIAEMETQLNAYKPKNGDFKMLGTNLSATNDKLVKSCTMTGTPHDVLHAWLAPHMKEIDKLKKAENREDANKIVGELKQSMDTYHTYFN